MENIKTFEHSDSPSFNELFEEYSFLFKNTLSKQTFDTKVSYYNKHFRQKYGHIIITDFKYKNAQNFINELLAKDLKPKTVKNIVNDFKVLLNYAIKNDYIQKNVFAYVDIPSFDNRIYFSFTEEEIKRFIQAVLAYPDLKYRSIFIFLLHGRRLNEVLSLTWDNIDFDNDIYFIPPQKNKARKFMKYQITFLLKEVLNYMKNYKTFKCSNSPYIFPSSVTCGKIKDIRRPFKKLLNFAGIDKKMRIHDIRHLIASYSINYLGFSVEEVSYTLGHTSIEITQRYINPRAEISKRVVEKILNSVKRA